MRFTQKASGWRVLLATICVFFGLCVVFVIWYLFVPCHYLFCVFVCHYPGRNVVSFFFCFLQNQCLFCFRFICWIFDIDLIDGITYIHPFCMRFDDVSWIYYVNRMLFMMFVYFIYLFMFAVINKEVNVLIIKTKGALIEHVLIHVCGL